MSLFKGIKKHLLNKRNINVHILELLWQVKCFVNIFLLYSPVMSFLCLSSPGQQEDEADAGGGAACEERAGEDRQEGSEGHERPHLGRDQPLRSRETYVQLDDDQMSRNSTCVDRSCQLFIQHVFAISTYFKLCGDLLY